MQNLKKQNKKIQKYPGIMNKMLVEDEGHSNPMNIDECAFSFIYKRLLVTPQKVILHGSIMCVSHVIVILIFQKMAIIFVKDFYVNN
jgi:hypothetical protein